MYVHQALSPVLVVLRSQSRLRLEGRTRTLSGPSPDLSPARKSCIFRPLRLRTLPCRSAGRNTGGVVGDRADFFVSHAGAERAWAEWVAWQLTDAGYTVELDAWDWPV